MTFIAKNELHFNLSCYEMAKSNLSLAYKYAIDLSPNFLSRYLPEPASASFELKDKCINLIVKAPLLSLRAFSLYVPILNRITQLALRFLSPKDPNDFIKSSPVHFRPKQEELEIRYSKATRYEFIKDHFKNQIEQKQEFNPSNLDLFKNWGFTLEKVLDIFTQLSPSLSIDFINSPEFKKDEVKVRYTEDTRREFIKKYFEEKNKSKEKIKSKDSKMSHKMNAISNTLGFTAEDCMAISLSVLAQSPEIKCSNPLKQKVNQL